MGLFSTYNLTTSSTKHLEDISLAHFVPLMYKLLTSSKDSDDLSIGFDRDCVSRQRELTNNETQKGKYHAGIVLKDNFGFAEHHEKATHGLGYKLTLTKNTDNSALNKDNATNIVIIKVVIIEWFVPHYTPNITPEALLSKQILSRTRTELQYKKKCFSARIKHSKYMDF